METFGNGVVKTAKIASFTILKSITILTDAIIKIILILTGAFALSSSVAIRFVPGVGSTAGDAICGMGFEMIKVPVKNTFEGNRFDHEELFQKMRRRRALN